VNILLATTEATPFAKTGGLADVCGALPRDLAQLGHNVSLIMPAFRQVRTASLPIEPTGVEVEIPIGAKTVVGSFSRSYLPESDVPVYFVENDAYYDRPELYRENGKDYRDNCERFVFFCRAALEAIRLLDLPIDVVHANDWPTGLIPAYLKTEYAAVPGYENIASLFTIHNIAYQGNFWHWDMVLTGLDWKYFNWRQMEFFGQLSLLKTGLAFADRINTVSARYAQEIQTSELGCGMEGLLAYRGGDVSGILNGVDYREWNPATDPHLVENYEVKNYAVGKAACKAALQQQVGLPQTPDAPLIGLIGRFADQKGFDLVAKVVQDWVRSNGGEGAVAQWVILGTGEQEYHDLFQSLAKRHPQRVAAHIGFSPELAHQIEAGADIFLMPSRYEPCGLNQLYSLRYGTVPVVRATGGLADTITSATPDTLAAGTANGFSFREYSALALAETLARACDAYRNPELWRQLVETGMKQDWSWARSARAYGDLYGEMIAARQQVLSGNHA
jgi:starch synthase